MNKHIIDRPKQLDNRARRKAFFKIERASMPSAATRKLQQEPRANNNSRIREYLRIERQANA